MSQPDAEDRWTIRRLIQWTSDFLRRKGSESPRLDSEVLLAHVLGWPRVQLYTNYEEEVAEKRRTTFRELVKRRAEGMPVAYLVGNKEFYALKFKVTPAVLIPRPETEFLVLEFLTAFKGHPSPQALDIGTGSGCVALSCLHHQKSARFIGVDISPEALEVAKGNAASLGLSDRFATREGNLLEPIREEAAYDAILSNPPYLRTEEIAGLDADVRDFEPKLALDGGPDGLRAIEPIVRDAARLLKPGGHLFFEFGYEQLDDVRKLVGKERTLDIVAVIRDHANHPRVMHAVRPA